MSPARSPLLPLLLLWGCAMGQSDPPPAPNATRPVFLCGGDHVGDSGYIASEGFPNHYPPGKTCTWTITVPEGQVVILSFRVFDLEPDPSCRYDSLEVFNGHSDSAQRLGRFCGTFRPGALLSTGNRMLLRMVTDEGTGGRGFLVWFSAGLPHVNGRPRGRPKWGANHIDSRLAGEPWHYWDEHQFCGGKLEKPQGSLKTPNWPESNYPAGISCSWHIIAPVGQVVELTFGKFDVEDDTYCRYDYVAIFNGGATDDSRRIGKFCGDRAPGPIYSEGSELLVQFVSDLSVTADGFAASYAIKSPSEATDKATKPAPGIFPGSKPGQAGTKPSGKPKPAPEPKPTVRAPPTAEPPSAQTPAKVECPQKCRRSGSLQTHFCANDFVITGTVKTAVRGAGDRVTATVSLLNTYKTGALSLPQAEKGATLRLEVPCRQCPTLKKGSSYIFMGRVDAEGVGKLSPKSFVVPYRQQQHQILTTLSKRPCGGAPKKNA
ncbi:procollagen C-endopeptidase enhancer 1 isoform X1 [Malaclemys terrapin pileata]|uniref:procollagen C-endopeptidase enhancer 1 isoform X1 n=1 Tax=Malaclemys terrapin pileata TaxID=2991368 RepID=UPI0023A8D4B2|nr:procollagen C-endopeptidase enhancer 1 isoform X1 [Malaclemys terrapin pileata]